MTPSSRLYLSKVSYLPEKRQVFAEFSNSSVKTSRRYSFFPKMVFPLRGIGNANFLEAVSSCDAQRFKVEFEKGNAVVFASSFEDLKFLGNVLSDFFGFDSCLIEPERQFLLEKGWSYFDGFDFRGDDFSHAGFSDFPDARMDFFAEPLKKTFSDLLSENRRLAKSTASSIALSNLLSLPISDCAFSDSPHEIILENVLFSGNSPIPLRKKSASVRKLSFESKSEIDFSKLAVVLSAKPFNNIGFGNFKCACCAPASHDAMNVLPSSKVNVRFLREAFYFSSFSASWAREYHSSHGRKENRLERMKEYGMLYPPAGPFARFEECVVPLRDALAMQANNEAQILGFDSLEWVCSSESSLSKAVNGLSEKIVLFDSRLRASSKGVVAANGILFEQVLGRTPEFVFSKAMVEECSRALGEFYPSLTNPQSRFFDPQVSSSLEAILDGLKADFESIARNEFSMQVSFSGPKAFMDSGLFGSFSRRFSTLYSVNPIFVSPKLA